jgi:FKBP-type peptidyl-prolyl cis-trans isomerase
MRASFAVVVASFVVACGSAPSAPHVALAPVHVHTLGERRADVCARNDLVALGSPIVGDVDTRTGDPPIVRSVDVRDGENLPVQVREDALAIHVGAPLTPDAGRDTIRRVWQSGKFDDVALETQSIAGGGGVAVIVRVVPKREIAHVFMSGDDDGGDLHVEPGGRYDAVALSSAMHAVVEHLKSEGHLDATLAVSSAFADAARRSVDVCIKLARGPLVTIGAIKIHGSAYDAALAEILARDDTENVVGHVVQNDVLERDELVLAAALYDHGLLEHKIKRTAERHGPTIAIDFAIEDGPTYRYGVVDVRGDLDAPKRDYMKLVTVKQGDVFSRTDMLAVVEKIRAMHKAAGHDDITVEPSTELDEPSKTIAITLEITNPHATTHAPPSAPRGFSIVELKRGQGRAAKIGDAVTVHYRGTLTNGKVFDDSHGRAPFAYTIGKGVIAGFDRGVTGMKVGGRRRVTIPPDMGYGTRATGNIPASSTLLFEIELLSIQ